MYLKLKICITGLLFLGITLTGNSFPSGTLDNAPANLKIFPNPVVDGSVAITSETQIKAIQILSIVGQVVYTNELEPSNSVRLYLDQIQPGIYLMKVTFIDKTSDTKRIWVK